MATPAMGLTLPVVGVTTGATAGTNIVDNFTIIDTHDHSSGKGVQIPTAGLNINAALSFGNQKAFNLLCTQFTSQTSSPTSAGDRPNVHVLNGDLYYVNSSGTAVQITNAGSISGASGSIGGLASPASAQFATNTFTWKATATDYAKFALSEINIYPFTTSPANALTLKVSNSVTAYTITLPDAPPISNEALIMASSGTVSTVSYDTIGSGMTSTGANSIAAARTRSTGTTVGIGGIAISASSATFSTSSSSLVDVTNLSVTITTSGRPVQLALIADGSGGTSGIQIQRSPTATTSLINTGFVSFVRGSTVLTDDQIGNAITSGASTFTNLKVDYPASAFAYIDAVSAGTVTYKLQVSHSGTLGSGILSVTRCKLIAFEL